MVACINNNFMIRVEMDKVDKSIYEINLINTSRQLFYCVIGYTSIMNTFFLKKSVFSFVVSYSFIKLVLYIYTCAKLGNLEIL